LPEPNATTIDGFLGNRIRLIQPAVGHRAGLDAALLQAMIPDDARGHLIDLGTGTGAVAMSAAARASGLTATGVDIDGDLIALAERSLALAENRAISGRLAFVQADAAAARHEREAAGLSDASADWVTMNPPFDVTGQVRASPDAARRQAHIGSPSLLADWLRTASGLLRPRGRLAIVHRADALKHLLDALHGRFGAVSVLPVHPRRGHKATRILVSAVRGAKAPLTIQPGLVLHGANGTWAEAAAAIVNGTSCLGDALQIPSDQG